VIPLPADTKPQHGIQPLHVIVKPDKKPRLVIDLSRNLNQFLQYQYFSYATLEDAVAISSPNCWYGKLDLSNCFLSFPLHPDVQQYFVFEFEGQLYQFVRMPFGLSTAPLVCTQLLSVVAFVLTQRGAHFIRYLDDFLFVAPTQAQLAATLQTAQQVFADFGLLVNPDKTEGPSQRITFLGIQLDSLSQTLSCTAQRVSELHSLLQPLRSQRIIRRRHLESVLGKLSFAAQVLPGARPFMRRMLDAIKRCRKRSTPVRIDAGFRADVRYWIQHLSTWNGRQRWRSAQADPFVLASDASLTGFGFYLESVPAHVDSSSSSSWPAQLRLTTGYSGSYSRIHARYHSSHTEISWCELLAVYAAAATYAPLLQNQTVLCYVDNSTDVAIINRQATRSNRLATLLRSLYDLALRYNFSIRATHRPGEQNQLADFLSRPDLHRNDHVRQWSLAHPSHSLLLQSVCLVTSRQFLDSNGCAISFASSPLLPSDATHGTLTPPITAPSSASAAEPILTQINHLQRSSSALSSSSMPQPTRSPLSQDSSPLSPIGLSSETSVPCPVTGSTVRSELVSTTSTADPMSRCVRQLSPSVTSPSSASTSMSPVSAGQEIGAPISSPSSVSFEFTNTQMEGSQCAA
jgi:hypothetical protein